MDLSKLHLHWRPRRRGKKVYKSFSLARAYWQDGKNKKEIVLKLGVLSDEEAERWRVTLKSFKNPDMPIGTKDERNNKLSKSIDDKKMFDIMVFFDFVKPVILRS